MPISPYDPPPHLPAPSTPTQSTTQPLPPPSPPPPGLNLLNTTNLDYFQAHHQAELFRLKGLFLQQLDDSDAANMAFSTALMLCRVSPEAWTSWATYCDAQFDRAREQAAVAGGGQVGASWRCWQPHACMLLLLIQCLSCIS